MRSDELAAIEASAELDFGRPGGRRVGIGPVDSAASLDAPARFDLELGRRALMRVENALRADVSARAALISISGTDAGGNGAELSATVTAKRRPGR